MNAMVEKPTVSPFPSRPNSAGGALVEVESQRAIAETQAAMVIAKRFPRDQAAAMDRILQACTRPALAESAQYQYARGGSDITGPSIRMAETLAREWGNMQYGIRELTQANGESEVEAFCWDIETNTRQVKVFKVPHIRYTKQGIKRLEDPRDVYEMVANQGARRLRACILGVIPGDVVDAAMTQCETTLKTKIEVTPELIKGMLDKFAEYSVSRGMIEKKIQRNIDSLTPAQVVQLRKIFNSLKDGMGSVADFFEVEATAEPIATTGTDGLKAAVKASAAAHFDPQDEALKGLEKAPPAAQEAASSAKSGAPVVTYAHVMDRLNKAFKKGDIDLLDADATMIGMVADEAQREELTVLYKALRKELAPE